MDAWNIISFKSTHLNFFPSFAHFVGIFYNFSLRVNEHLLIVQETPNIDFVDVPNWVERNRKRVKLISVERLMNKF